MQPSTADLNARPVSTFPSLVTSHPAIDPRVRMSVALALSDLISVAAAWWVAIAIRTVFGGFSPQAYISLTPVASIFIAAYALRSLYPATGLGPTEELRRLSKASSLVFLALGILFFLERPSPEYSRFVFGLSWMLCLASVPLGRAGMRAIVSSRSWWGERTAVINVGKPSLDLTAHLSNNPSVGFRPELRFDLELSELAANADPTSNGLAQVILASREHNVHDALVVSDAALSDLGLALEACRDVFERVILVDTRPGMRMAWAASADLAGVSGLEIRHNLLNPAAQAIKRGIDLFGAVCGILLLLPAYAVIALAIKLDSPGPVLYRQQRVGKRGKHYNMLKLRTMRQDADQLLPAHLRENAALREEWLTYQKLRDDPRVTHVGRWLRKLSLDEFPQLWNVLRGEMSLVGPRPYFPEQQEAYGKGYESYIRVLPGITGMWQVSGRSNSTFESRVKLDEYYVRNWSLFLDIYLMARTVMAVSKRDGAC